MSKFSLPAAVAAALLIGPAAGCAADDLSAGHDGAPSSVTVTDQWARAVDSGMTSLFGTFHNDGDQDTRMVSATSPVAEVVELHEVITGATGASVMQERADGFHIPAGGSHDLTPGGDHLMLIDLTEPLTVGSDVNVVAVFDDGSELPFVAQVRDFAGGDEDYHSDADTHDHHGHG